MNYSLSLKKQGKDSKLIATISKGKNNGKNVYLVRNNEDGKIKKDFDYDALDEKMKTMRIK